MEDTPPHRPHHLPPGLGEGQVERVTRAAEGCLAALDAPRNWAMEAQLPVDLARAVFERYAAGAGGWAEADLVQVLDARGALREATDALRAAHDARGGDPDAPPSALEDAESLIGAMNTLYVELDTALRRIAPETVESARTDLASARDTAVSRAAAEPEFREIEPKAKRVREDIETVESEGYRIGTQININVLNFDFGSLNISIEQIKARLASINISFNAEAVWKGVVELSTNGFERALEAIRAAANALETAASDMADASQAVSGVVSAIRSTAEDGRALIETVRGAVRRLFGPREEAPWPTGLRLLPPVGRADAPRDVALVEVRRFETGDEIVRGLAPLPGGRFVSGGSDGVLRLWSVDQATPLVELRGHEEMIWRIAALDGRRVVTASNDRTLILWDLEARAARETFRGHDSRVLDVAALDRDRFVSVADKDGCRLWSTGRAAADRVWTFDDPHGVAALAPDRIVTGEYHSPDLRLLDPGSDAPLGRITAEGAELWKAAAVTGTMVLTVDDGGGLRLWDWESGACAAALKRDALCEDVALFSTARAVSAHHAGAMLWSLPDGVCLAKATPGARLRAVRALPPAPGGPARLVLGGEDGYLALWEVRPADQAAS